MSPESSVLTKPPLVLCVSTTWGWGGGGGNNGIYSSQYLFSSQPLSEQQQDFRTLGSIPQRNTHFSKSGSYFRFFKPAGCFFFWFFKYKGKQLTWSSAEKASRSPREVMCSSKVPPFQTHRHQCGEKMRGGVGGGGVLGGSYRQV